MIYLSQNLPQAGFTPKANGGTYSKSAQLSQTPSTRGRVNANVQSPGEWCHVANPVAPAPAQPRTCILLPGQPAMDNNCLF